MTDPAEDAARDAPGDAARDAPGRAPSPAVRRLRLPRPLDPVRSIKAKLAVLVAASCTVAVVIVKQGLQSGYMARYTLPVAVVIALVVTQFLAHGMTSPLREMTRAARAMARGDYSRRVRASSKDEVGELAGAFNQMAVDLAEEDRRRREFVANVSHELRTPISALQALLENLADGVTPASAATLRAPLEQTERLTRLVGQLLDLSGIDAGAAALQRVEFEVRPFLAAVVEDLHVEGAGPRFVLDAPAGLRVNADRDRLHQVVINLLDNAVRHGPPDGTVTVMARPIGRPGGLLLEVCDEGPGIPPEQRDRVFERFSRGTGRYGPDGSYGPDGGTGLGLAIARWAVRLHGGEILVADARRGCRIRITLPGSGAPTRRGRAGTGRATEPIRRTADD